MSKKEFFEKFNYCYGFKSGDSVSFKENKGKIVALPTDNSAIVLFEDNQQVLVSTKELNSNKGRPSKRLQELYKGVVQNGKKI